MGKLQVFDVVFSGDQCVFKPGDVVQGEVRIVVSEEKGDIRGIEIKFCGKAYTHWTESEGSGDNRRTVHYSWKIPYFKEQITLKGAGRDNSSADRIMLTAGEHRFPFQFRIPVQDLPPPFEGTYGYVRYYIKATIDRPWKFDHHTKRLFSIFTVKDLNYHPNVLMSPSHQTEKTVCCLCCASGPIVLKASIDKSGYVPGEYIFISVDLSNNSSRTITDINISLKQRAHFTAMHCARTHHRRSTKKVAQMQLDGCEAMGSVHLERRQMIIPPIAPNCFQNCGNIQVEYLVEIEADVSGTPMDAEIEFPVVIGTIPAFQQTVKPPGAVPPVNPAFGQPGGYPPPGQPQPAGYPPPGAVQPGYPPAPQPQAPYPPGGEPQPGYPPLVGEPQPGYPPPSGQQPGYPPVGAEQGGVPPPGYPPNDQGPLPPPPTYEAAVEGPQELPSKKGYYGTVSYAPQYPCYNPDTLYSAMGIPSPAPLGQEQAPTMVQPQASPQPPFNQ